jgi:hypothetical protein
MERLVNVLNGSDKGHTYFTGYKRAYTSFNGVPDGLDVLDLRILRKVLSEHTAELYRLNMRRQAEDDAKISI